MSRINLGLDLGNYYTKTSHTSVSSGFSSYGRLPFGADEYLMFGNNYYIPNPEPFPYVKDKTRNENAFILSLLGLSKELLYRANDRHNKRLRLAEKDPMQKAKIIGVQEELNQMSYINLGVGVPPTHFSTLKDATITYYCDRLAKGVEYTYKNYHFSYQLMNCECYAQDVAAIIGYSPAKKEKSVTRFKRYVAIDLGGQTLDIVTFDNGSIDREHSDSKPLGILMMYENIIRIVEMETGKRIDKEIIESVLRFEPTILDESLIELIFSIANDWFLRVLSACTQLGIDFDTYPVLFLGGGILLLRQFIRDDMFAAYEIIDNPCANAIGYEKMITLDSKRK